MNPAILAATRAALADWQREADNSREQAERLEEQAGGWRVDQERAEAKVRELQEALRAEGVAP